MMEFLIIFTHSNALIIRSSWDKVIPRTARALLVVKNYKILYFFNHSFLKRFYKLLLCPLEADRIKNIFGHISVKRKPLRKVVLRSICICQISYWTSISSALGYALHLEQVLKYALLSRLCVYFQLSAFAHIYVVCIVLAEKLTCAKAAATPSQSWKFWSFIMQK